MPFLWQDRASSSFLGSSHESGGANPPPATSLIVCGRYGHFFVRRIIMIEAICIGIKNCFFFERM